MKALFAAATKIDLASAVKHLRDWMSYIDGHHRQKYADLLEAQAKLIAHFVSTPPSDDARSALPPFEDSCVQVVYEILCGDKEPPNKDEHWEGWVSRKIVAALRSAPLSVPAREALIEEFSHFPNREGVGRHVAIVDWFLERYARAVCEIDGYDYDRERRLAQNGEMSAREIINRALLGKPIAPLPPRS